MRRCAGRLALAALLGCWVVPGGAAGLDPDALTVADFAFLPGADRGFVAAYRTFLKARAGDQEEGAVVPTYGQAAGAFARLAGEAATPAMRLRCAWCAAFCRFLDMDFAGAAETARTLRDAEALPPREAARLTEVLRQVDHGLMPDSAGLGQWLRGAPRPAEPPSLDVDVVGKLAALLERSQQTSAARQQLTTYPLRTRLFDPGTPREQLCTLAILAVLFETMSVNVAENREKLNQALCAANLRQLGVCLHRYAQDHDGFFPEAHDFVARQIWEFKLFPYTNSPSWEQRGEVWQCPSCSPGAYSYGLNQNVSIRSTAFPSAGSRDRVTKPAATVLLADSVHYLPGEYPHKPNYGGAAYKISWPKEHLGTGTTDWSRHSGGANVLFVDGRVQWRTAASPLEWLGS